MWKRCRRAICFFLPGCFPQKDGARNSLDASAQNSMWKRDRKAAHLAALNVLAVARQHLGSLDKVTRIVRLGVFVATSGDVRDQPRIADAASELLQDVFGKEK